MQHDYIFIHRQHIYARTNKI